MFLRKGHVEKSATAMSLKLLSKCDGAYLVLEMPSEQNAALGDPVTEARIEACSNGRTIAVDRLVVYPVRREDLPHHEEPLPDTAILALTRNDIIAVVGDGGAEETVYLAQVDENHPQQQTLGVYPMESVGQMRLRARQWKLMTEARMVGYAEVICRIFLEPTGVLTAASVEDLVMRGIAV